MDTKRSTSILFPVSGTFHWGEIPLLLISYNVNATQVMFINGEEIAQHGFFVGYNWFVWITIAIQSCGGILVSLCVKYADNIAKSFAMGISILISLCASVWFFDFAVTTNVGPRKLDEAIRPDRQTVPRWYINCHVLYLSLQQWS